MSIEQLKTEWKQALNAFENDDFASAGAICRNIVESKPNFPQAWYMLASIAVKFNQKEAATDYLDKGKAYAINNPDLMFEMARLFYVVGEYESAKEFYTSLPDGHKSPTILHELGKTLWQLGSYTESIQCFESAMLMGEHHPKFSLALMKAYLSFGVKDKAIKVCKDTLEKYPSEQDLLLYYYLFLWDAGLHEEVLEKLPTFPEGQADELNYFVGAVKAIKGDIMDSETFFHPLLQQERYRAKIKGFNELISGYKKDNFFVTFPADLFYIAKEAAIPGDVYEFGVYRGRSTSMLASVFNESTVFGFDSFLGLPEQWTKTEAPGTYTAKGNLPKVSESNVQFIEGWYKDSLPSFFSSERKPASLIHVDCDLYSSTKLALDESLPVIVPGTLILFDDFTGYHGYEKHEHKAFFDFVEQNNIKFEILNYAFMGREVLVRILSIG